MTISEIAKMAGVSSATVSRYFNNGYLSEEKRKTIEKVVKKTGYQPSPQAQMLRTRKTRMVGVVLPRIESSSIARIVAGISAVMNRKKYKIVLANTENNPDMELDYMKVFDNKQVDGLILVATVLTEEHYRMIRKLRIPIVVVGQRVEGVDSIYHDDYHATCELTELMIQKGRTGLAYIAAIREDRAVGNDRTNGYMDTVKAHGLTGAADRIVTAGFSIESGKKQMKQLLSEYPEIDAVIAATDSMAVGAIQAVQAQGYRVPEDILVGGIGNSPFCEVITPTLTTVDYEYEDSGKQAARLILKKMTGEETERDTVHTSVQLGHRLIERESTGV